MTSKVDLVNFLTRLKIPKLNLFLCGRIVWQDAHARLGSRGDKMGEAYNRTARCSTNKMFVTGLIDVVHTYTWNR